MGLNVCCLWAFPFFLIPAVFAAQGDEGDGDDIIVGVARGVAAPDLQVLAHTPADRQHQPAANIQLLQEGLGDAGGRGGDEDALIGGVLRPAGRAIGAADADVFVFQFIQGFSGVQGQGWLPRRPRHPTTRPSRSRSSHGWLSFVRPLAI